MIYDAYLFIFQKGSSVVVVDGSIELLKKAKGRAVLKFTTPFPPIISLLTDKHIEKEYLSSTYQRVVTSTYLIFISIILLFFLHCILVIFLLILIELLFFIRMYSIRVLLYLYFESGIYSALRLKLYMQVKLIELYGSYSSTYSTHNRFFLFSYLRSKVRRSDVTGILTNKLLSYGNRLTTQPYGTLGRTENILFQKIDGNQPSQNVYNDIVR